MEPIRDLDLGKFAPISARKLAFVDFETTGWNPTTCDIIDAAVICEGLPWTTKIWVSEYDEDRANRACGRGWIAVTGYTREEWATAPKGADVVEDFARQLHGKIWVGMNAAFDTAFGRSFCQRHGVSWDQVYSGTMVDLHPLCKNMLGPLGLKKFDLASVCEFLGLEKEAEHRALGGAQRARRVFHELCKRVWRP